MPMNRRHLLASAAAGLALPWSLPTAAQAWPARPIRLVSPYGAGGSNDILTRVLGDFLSRRLGQSVVVENKAGAGTRIANDYVAKAAPDGYTLLMAPSTFTMAQLVLKTAPSAAYDVRGFTPIIQVGAQPLFIVAGPGSKARSLKEAMDESKKSELAYASPGSGSPMHVLGEMFNRASGANFRHVPYRGVAPALTDVAGGHVPLTWMTYGPVEPYLADGKLRLLGVAQAERTPLAPQVPTLAELGFKGVEVAAWNGLYGPKGLPAEIVSRLNTQLNEIIRLPDVAAKMKTLGVLPVGGPPDTLAKTTAADLERFTRVVKELNIQAD